MSMKVRSTEFSDHLAFNILSRLPLKSLTRFRCVQKSWSDLLENPQFLRTYCQNLASEDDDSDSSLLLKHEMPDTHKSYLYKLSGERYEKMVKLDWPSSLDSDGEIYLLGPCINGMICPHQDPLDRIVLWNPATEEFKTLSLGLIDPSPRLRPITYVFGFGYDHVTHDYKVIQSVRYGFNDDVDDDDDHDGHLNTRGFQVIPDSFWQIYSLKSDCWRKLNLNIDLIQPQPHDYSIYLNGMCHWWAFERSPGGRELLVSLDMRSEVFITTPLPINLLDLGNPFYKRLVVFNKSIAMISNIRGRDNCFDISILGEIGVKESWIKLLTIGPLPCIEEPVGIANRGKILFRKNDHELACFDLSTQRIWDIGIKGEIDSCQTICYKESFHLVGGISKA